MNSATPRFTMPTPEAPPAANGRDSNGRFAKGNAGGPGNPYARQVAALRRALLQLVTEEEITAIAKALLEQAKRGNVAAAKLLFAYTLGQPAKAVDPDRLPEHELDTLSANYAEPEAVTALLNRQSLEDFLPVIQIAMACQQQQVKDHLGDRLTQAEQEDQKNSSRRRNARPGAPAPPPRRQTGITAPRRPRLPRRPDRPPHRRQTAPTARPRPNPPPDRPETGVTAPRRPCLPCRPGRPPCPP